MVAGTHARWSRSAAMGRSLVLDREPARRAPLQTRRERSRSHPPGGLTATPQPGFRCFPSRPDRARELRARRRASAVETDLAASRLVEFALVVPILLLVFAAAADLGRAFYAYVAIENGVKEGAFYGARAPLCTDDAVGRVRQPRATSSGACATSSRTSRTRTGRS